MKNFKDIRVDDTVYECVISDTTLYQDGIGNNIIEHFVVGSFNNTTQPTIKLTLQRKKYKFNVGLVKDDSNNPVEKTITFPKNETVLVRDMCGKEIPYGLGINKSILATSKKELAKAVANIIDSHKKIIEEVNSAVKLAKSRNETMTLRFTLVGGMALLNEPEEEDKPLTEEEFACMAL